MDEPETPQQVVSRLGVLPPETLTDGQTRALNRARFQFDQAARREERRLAKEAERAAKKEAEKAGDDSALVASAVESFACAREGCDEDEAGPTPDHAALELEARDLYGLSLKNLSRILKDPQATNQDRLQAASHLRLAAGIGASDPAPTVYRLPMASLLGADGPRQVDDPPGEGPDVVPDATTKRDDAT